MKLITNLVKGSMKKLGFQSDINDFSSDFTQEDIDIIQAVRPYTMTSQERIFSLIQVVKYVVKNNIEGDIVECGVWKGGSMLAVAKTLVKC